ncbi:VOC family metalloprotein YjdN [Pantoea sp. FN060301]|uniref:VOC family metalloprotein YjdN n=1 Tax=Pantoea sp. FN060301 TaxID=3420380 RepID=UPI003D179710
MQITPYLFFSGNCEEAIAFYHQAIDAHLAFKMTWGDMPPDRAHHGCDSAGPLPAEKIMHAQLRIGDSELLMCDSPDTAPVMAGSAIALSTVDLAEGKRWFDNLAVGGTITRPWEETFWASGFGMLTDRFSIAWMVSAVKQQGR